jgi:hypothetical protein
MSFGFSFIVVLTLSLPSWKIILAISAAEIQRLAKSPIPRKLVASYNKNTVLVPGGQNRGKFRRRQNEADSFCLAEAVRTSNSCGQHLMTVVNRWLERQCAAGRCDPERGDHGLNCAQSVLPWRNSACWSPVSYQRILI